MMGRNHDPETTLRPGARHSRKKSSTSDCFEVEAEGRKAEGQKSYDEEQRRLEAEGKLEQTEAVNGADANPGYSSQRSSRATSTNSRGLPRGAGGEDGDDDDGSAAGSEAAAGSAAAAAGTAAGGGGRGSVDSGGGGVGAAAARAALLACPRGAGPCSGAGAEMVRCAVVRDRTGARRLYPQYRMYFQDTDTLALVAQKQSKNRTSNYHIFDMMRAGFGNHLSKKNGNYLGKLRSNSKKTENVIFTNDHEKEELGAITFEKTGFMDQVKEGSQPRKLKIILPQLDPDGIPLPNKPERGRPETSLLSRVKIGQTGRMFYFESKDPVFEKGNYRLNFHGRVTVASVKNFQLVSPDDIDYVVCQFGKVDEDRFHLDYRAPFNAFQAFAVTLCQFNF